MSYDLKIINGDLVINNGDLAKVTGNNKLAQDLLKIALTEMGADPINPWYGSLVSKTLIGSYVTSDIISSVATTQLKNAVENLKSLQNLQAQSLQKMTPDEQILSISDILVSRNSIDLRLFSIVIKVLDRTFHNLSVSFNLPNM